jgi:hypothetical protein
MQSVLWDRRLVLAILDHIGVPTPRRVEVSRDGGPVIDEGVREKMKKELGLIFGGWGGEGPKVEGGVVRGKDVQLREDGDAVIVNGTVVEKPFVEKVSLLLPFFGVAEMFESLHLCSTSARERRRPQRLHILSRRGRASSVPQGESPISPFGLVRWTVLISSPFSGR